MKIYLITAIAALAFTTANAQPGQRGQRPNPDADGDGKVTMSEFRAADGVRQSRVFARMDVNNDGKISSDEARPVAPDAGAPNRGGGILLMDANKDGFVTKDELSAISQRRFQMADKNNDGWLSGEEMDMMRQRTRGPGK